MNARRRLSQPRRCSSSSDDDWDRVLDTNLRGTFLGAREAGAGDGRRGTGRRDRQRLLDGRLPRGAPGAAHYVASKFGVRGLTQALAVELGPHGIRVLERRSDGDADAGPRGAA